jgi:hypothetical protein
MLRGIGLVQSKPHFPNPILPNKAKFSGFQLIARHFYAVELRQSSNKANAELQAKTRQQKKTAADATS